MNLESKELPESFLVQVIWEWLTIRCQTMLSPHPHASVTSLCAETMQSGWWVLSVISWWKIFLKWHTHEGSNELFKHCFHCKVFKIQGQRGVWLFLHPSFYFCLLSCVMWWAVQNLLQTGHDRRTSAVISTKNTVVKEYYTLLMD